MDTDGECLRASMHAQSHAHAEMTATKQCIRASYLLDRWRHKKGRQDVKTADFCEHSLMKSPTCSI